MRKLLLSLLILLPALQASAEEVNAIMLHLASGKVATFPLCVNPFITVNGDNIALSTDIWKVNIPSSNVEKITYESVDIAGDVNLDELINVSDVSQIVKVLNGSEQIPTAYDVNKDGVVNAQDVEDIKSLILGKKMIIDGRVSSYDIQNSEGEQNADDAMYVYRNDGDFDAFIRSEVDSMRCSCLDVDNVAHKEWQTQMVYTADSIYRIPLNVIDSVSFVTPETKVNNNVFQLTTSHIPYLSECDTLHFTLSLSTPEYLLPSKGNIVVSTYDCTSFPDGIMARVLSKNQDSNGIRYDCEQVGINDVFDQLIVVGYGYSEDEKNTLSAKGAKSSKKFDWDIWDVGDTKTLEYSGTTTTVKASDKAVAKFVINNKKGYFRMSLTNNLTTSIDFVAKSSFAKYYERPVLENLKIGKIPIPGTYGLLWITPKFSLSAFFEESATVSLELKGHYNRTDKVNFTLRNNAWNVSHTVLKNDPGIDVASLSMDGYMEIGLIPDLLFSGNGTATGLGFEYTAGIKETVHFNFDGIAAYDEGMYSALKDCYARTTIPQELRFYASWGLFGNGTRPYSKRLWENEPQLGPDKYLLPLFTEPVYSQGATPTTAILESDISRDLLLPVEVGMTYYDGDTKVSSDYMPINYQNKDEWTLKGIKSTFSKMSLGKTYTAYPIVKILGKELRAVPSCEFSSKYPVAITSFKVTKSNYSPGAYYNDAITYDYKFDAATTVTLDEEIDISTIADWGYVYKDPNGNIKRISLMKYSSPYTDTGYAYYRNEAKSTVCLYPYIKFIDDEDYLEGDPVYYNLVHEEETLCPDDHHPHIIDLGLPSGTKWCCCNVGATSPEESGGYFSWGETSSKTICSTSTYTLWTDADADGKICKGECTFIGTDISGTEYDAATHNMGIGYRTPTYTQWEELISQCTWTATTFNGVVGVKVTGANGNKIFLPQSGCCRENGPIGVGEGGNYWTSTLDPEKVDDDAYRVAFSGASVSNEISGRVLGRSVRAVHP